VSDPFGILRPDPDDGPGISGGDLVGDAGALDEAAAQVAADLDAAVTEVGRIDQTAEEAVAEAVDLAKQFESERNELRDLVQRVQADFENYRRRVEAQRIEQRAQAAADLVRELLPVLDTCEAALAQGQDSVGPVHSLLLATLEKQGLSAVAEAGVEFDPNVHEAVLHEEGAAEGGPVVAEVMRTGYVWNERVVRPAMVKVRG
jgi:molecular chaperone GrpE